MKYIQFFPNGLRRNPGPPPFHEAFVFAGMTLVGIFGLTRVGLRLGKNFEWVILAMNAVALITMLFMLFRIRVAYKHSAEAAAAGDKAAVHALNGMMYSFRWGNALYLLMSLAVLYLYNSRA